MRLFFYLSLSCAYMPGSSGTLEAIVAGNRWIGRGAARALVPDPEKFDPEKTEPMPGPPHQPNQPKEAPIPTDVPTSEPRDVPAPDPQDPIPPTPTDPHVPPQPRPIP